MAEVRGSELADFLRRARASVDPDTAGLPADGRIRRVPGLRREEVARLAGVSTDYYTRLEQGRSVRPSPAVVGGIARALELDQAARAHLEHLLGGASSAARGPSTPVVQRLRPGIRQLLDALDAQPVIVLGRRSDVLATTRLGRALIADFDAMPAVERNYARWMFLRDEPRSLFADWDVQARAAVESLRLDLGAHPDDRAARALVDDLSSRDEYFREWWSRHRVFERTYGSKSLNHPIVGPLTVQYETFTLPGDPSQALFMYSAEPGTPSKAALDLLTSWAMSDDQQRNARTRTDLRSERS